MKVWLTIVIVLVLLLALGLWTGYNGFVNADADVRAQIGNLNAAYQERSDLVPNLVEVVKGAAGAEQKTLTDVISARAKATQVQLTPEALKDPQAMSNFQAAQGNLGSALSRLMVVSEQYPTLQSQANFPMLAHQLEGQENRIRVERDKYNAVVREYNVRVRRFPGNISARMFGFTPYAEFTASEGAENAPHVDMSGLKPQVQPEQTTPSSTAPTTAAPSTAPSSGSTPSHGLPRPAPVQR